MKCLEVNEFSACEIGPSHWLWNFSWLIEENGGERKGGAYWKLRERPLMTAIQMWKINKPTKKQNLFINCTFSILQLSTTCLTLDLGLPGWDSPPVLHLPRQLEGEKPFRRWWPAPQRLGGSENWRSTAAQSLSKQPKVKRNGADRWGGKGWGTGFRWALICFCNSLRFSQSHPRQTRLIICSSGRWLFQGFLPPLVLYSQKHPCQPTSRSVTSLCPPSGHMRLSPRPQQPIPCNKINANVWFMRISFKERKREKIGRCTMCWRQRWADPSFHPFSHKSNGWRKRRLLVGEQEALTAGLQLRMSWRGLQFPFLAPLMWSCKSILAPCPQAEQQTIQTF